MRRLVLFLLIVVALVLACWAIFTRDGDSLPAQGPAETVGQGSASDPLAASRADAEGTIGRASSAQRSAIEERDSGDGSIRAADEETFDLLVVRRRGESAPDEPVAGAEVWFTTAGVMANIDYLQMLKELGDDLEDVERAAQQWGQRAETGADGTVALPRGTERVEVFARKDNWTARHTFALRHGQPIDEPVLRLRPEVTLRVVVRDPADQPVRGARVGYGWLDPDGTFSPYFRGTTGADGVALIRHANVPIQTSGSPPRGVPRVGVYIAGVPGGAVHVPVPPSEETEVEIVVRTPAVGLLRVGVEMPDGKPYGMFGSIAVTPEDGPKAAGSSKYLMGDDRWSTLAVVGEKYRVEARLDYTERERVVAGPTAHGEIVDVVFPIGSDLPVLTGTVMGEDGRPAKGNAVFLTILRPDNDNNLSMSRAVPLRDDGTFACALMPTLVGTEVDHCRIVIDDQAKGPKWAFAPLPSPLPRGEVALGEVVVVQPPLLVAGEVLVDGVRRDRTPSVRLQSYRAASTGERSWNWFFGGLDHRDHGQFWFFGNPPPTGDALRLTVTESGLLPVPPIPVTPGQKNVVIETSAGGDARIVLTHEASLPHGALRAQLVPTGGEVATVDEEALRTNTSIRLEHVPRTEGQRSTVTWRGLWPGSYRLELRTHGLPEPITVVDGLEVVAGRLVDWPELALDGLVREVELRAFRSDGAAVEYDDAGYAFVLHRDTKQPLRWVRFREGVAPLLLPAEQPVSVIVLVPEHLPERLTDPRDEVEVRLRPFGYEVSLELDRAALEALPGATWSLDLKATDGRPLFPALQDAMGDRPVQSIRAEKAPDLSGAPAQVRVRLGSDGKAAGRLPRPGPWSISAVVSSSVGDRAVAHRVAVVEPREVTAGPTATAVRVTIPAEEVEAARAALR